MNLLPAHRQQRSAMPEPFGWFAGFPTAHDLAQLLEGHFIKVEEDMADGKYVLRAEIPGIDPAKDVTVKVHDGVLTVDAERSQRSESAGHSEFTYGSFTRSVVLPVSAQEDDIVAAYDKGILTVTVPVSEASTPAEKQITVQTGQ